MSKIRHLPPGALTFSTTSSAPARCSSPLPPAAALKLQSVVGNTRLVLAIEALTAARALDFLRPLRTSAPLKAVRALLPRIEGDQPLTAAIERAEEVIGEGALDASA
ncbi:MAG: aromatic amino acid lyase [Bryobacteraceae bacterium]